MIAACPKCQAKYRVDAARLAPEGARLRCAKCQAVFRVRAPAAVPQAQPMAERAAEPVVAPPAPQPVQPVAQPQPPAPAPDVDASIDRDKLVVVADPDVESGKRMLSALESWGLQPVLVHDGVEALLTIQRMLPRAAILDAALPKMYGFQICEMVKRNDSLRSIHIVLVGSVHHQNRYRRPPSELYGADLYLEQPALPEGLLPALRRFGYDIAPPAPVAAPAVAPAPAPAMVAAPQAVAAPEPVLPIQVARPQPVAPQPAAAPVPVAPLQPAAVLEPVAAPGPVAAPEPADALAEQRANAERLARIIVSDILLYHPEQFAAGMAAGNIAEALNSAIQEGRGFFAQRVDPGVRDERDFILDELNRVARDRGGQ